MPRTATTNLTSKSARARLKVRPNPYFESVAPRRTLGYIRKVHGAGSWCVQQELGERSETGAQQRRRAFLGLADDLTAADGIGTLSHSQARGKAASWNWETLDAGALTVRRACADYVAAKRATPKGAKTAEDAEKRLRRHVLGEDVRGKQIPGVISLADRPVNALTLTELKRWRDALVIDDRSHSTVNRISKALKAVLNHAFKDTEHSGIKSDIAWRLLEAFKDTDNPREDHFSTEEAQRLIDAIADSAFRNLVAASWYTGARLGELVGCDVRHVDHKLGLLMIPGGKTGARAATLTPEVAEFFSLITKGRRGAEPLLPNPNGERWTENQQAKPMKDALARAGLPTTATFYSLRHSYISRAIEHDVPISLIAANCGTSIVMIERFYAKYLAKKRVELLARATKSTRLTLVPKPEVNSTAA